jgi:hypothetical protein
VNDGKPLPTREILDIYQNGKNAKVGETVRSLRSFATNPNRAKEFPDDATFYKSDTFLDDPVVAAINGTGPAASYTPAERRQAIQKGIARILRYWTVQELLAAEPKLRDGDVDPGSGAPHNVDEAWALYVGAEQDGKYPFSLAATAQSREANFERPGLVDRPLREAFVQAQKATLARDLAGFQQAKNDIVSRLNALFYLSAARYVNEAAKSVQAGNADAAKVGMMEGYSYYLAIQPIVAKVDAAADKAVVDAYRGDPNRLTFSVRDQVLQALNRAGDTLGLKATDRLTPADYK